MSECGCTEHIPRTECSDVSVYHRHQAYIATVVIECRTVFLVQTWILLRAEVSTINNHSKIAGVVEVSLRLEPCDYTHHMANLNSAFRCT